MRELYYGLFRSSGAIQPLGYFYCIDEVDAVWGSDNIAYIWTAKELNRAYSYAVALTDGLHNPDLEKDNDHRSW